MAYDWMQEFNPDLEVIAMELLALNEEKFPRFLINSATLEKSDPVTFWTIVEKQRIFEPDLCRFIQLLRKLPASGSGIERCFSTLKSILSKSRNRLSVEKSSRLCIINQSLRFSRDDNDDEN